MKRFKIALTLAITIFLLTGCMAGMVGGDVKSYANVTYGEKAGFAMALYNNAASEYVWMYNTRKKPDGTLSENDIKVLQKYWKALDTTHTAIAIYDAWITAGDVPTEEMEDELVQIIRTLSILTEDN